MIAVVTDWWGYSPSQIGLAVSAVGAYLLSLFWPKIKPHLPWLRSAVQSPVTPATNPDVRAEFTTKLHWITEFARNELKDPEMVKDCNALNEKFTAIRETSAK